MCGISGIVALRPDGLEAAIGRMVASMQHRGPDGTGTLVAGAGETGALALGHNRLAIIDLSDHAAQPMASRDGRLVMVYNGEVYNYREIRETLPAEHRPDATAGDTEVVLAALALWGTEAFARFNGMWALLLYDRQEQTLLIARDRLGVKPMYLYRDGARLLIASEIKAILAAGVGRLEVNPDVAIPYLTRGLLDFSNGTFFRGIEQFPAASWARLSLRDGPTWPWTPRRYWKHPAETGEPPEAGRVSPAQLRETFVDSVNLRLRSDVPIGVLLSGGVDSSAIVGAIRSLDALDNVTVLSVTSDDPDANEEPFIDLVARYNRVTPQKVNVSTEPLGLLAEVGDAVWSNDEPLTSIAAVAHQRLMAVARQRGIKVLLTGQGADEQLGGYNKFLYFWLRSLLGEGRYGSALRTVAAFARHSNTLYEFRFHEARRYFGARGLATGTFIAPAHQQRDTVDIGFHGSYALREWVDLSRTSVPALLHYEDRMSMSRSVEMRVPFLDVRLVECLAQVHPSEKFAGGWTKSIFRKAIGGLVPREVQYRRDKRGFSVPEDRWMRGAFRPRVLEAFGPHMAAAAVGLVDGPGLRAWYGRFAAGDNRLNGRHFFRVYAFEAFLQRFGATFGVG
jgi:asparagine synthase (glutamine-hydrolysing)